MARRKPRLWSRKSVAKMVTVVVLVPFPVPLHPHSDPTRISDCQGHQHKKGYERNVAMGLGWEKKYPEGTFLFFKMNRALYCMLFTYQQHRSELISQTLVKALHIKQKTKKLSWTDTLMWLQPRCPHFPWNTRSSITTLCVQRLNWSFYTAYLILVRVYSSDTEMRTSAGYQRVCLTK